MRLPDEWVSRIFMRLDGIYGAQFRNKFSKIEDGRDVGLLMAKEVWAEELGGFVDRPDAIAYALKHLPSDKAPNAIEFRELCRAAPRKTDAPRLDHKQTPEEIERQHEMAMKVAKSVKSSGYDCLLWAKRPRSQKAMDVIADAGKEPGKYPFLANIFKQHIRDGVCNEFGKLLKRFDGIAWVKVGQ